MSRRSLRSASAMARERSSRSSAASIAWTPASQRRRARALLLHVHRVAEARELGQRLEREDDVLVQLEGVGAGGDRPELLAVGPEPLRLDLVLGLEQEGVA